MTTKINPPVFGKGKNYERFKQELLAWREITDLSKEKQGIAVALTLPENDETQIREKVFDQLRLDELKNYDGLNVLINFLDQHLAKDDLTDSLEKFEDFEDFKRLEAQSINEFVAMFDSKYRKIEKKNMTLPPEILAFKLLRKANISKEEKLLVLTGMNYDNKKTLYDEAKKSLKKFKGNEISNNQASIKLEPAFLAANEEALLAAGYSKTQGGYQGYQGNYSSERGKGWKRGKLGKFNLRENQRVEFATENQKKGLVKNINPTGPDGRLLTCKSCGSFRHLLPACPDSWENMKKVHAVEEEHAVLFTGYDTNEIRRLGVDARNCAVLDSACSSTVCGSSWMDNYIQSLNQTDREKVLESQGQRVFKFGGGTCLKSKGEFRIPAVVAGKVVTIKTDVVDSDIPLLLSRTAMKKASVKMDLENDTATIMGKELALNLTTSGHYCIPIDKTVEVPVENVCAVNLENLTTQERYKTLLKLHGQFAHPPKKRLASLMKDAGIWKDDYEKDLDQIENRCELCKVYAKTPSRPVVGMPMASKFNEKVAMDLKLWSGKWILHIIDMWSRYTLSIFIDRKKSCNIIDALMREWVGKFGVMGSLMTDNGGEFNSDEIREITSILNVQLCTTSAESPFQNGLCERVHAITDMMLTKLHADNKTVEMQTLLSWANMARNSLQMWNGYSSHQLVFGQNPNNPNIMSENLPGLQGSTSSEEFAKHLNLLHATRRAYIQSEADERIRRALRNKVRASEQVFEHGDRIFYKKEGRERWLGPGKVVFQDGKVVFVRHGAVFVRVSPNRLQKVNKWLDSTGENDVRENQNADVGANAQPEIENTIDQQMISEELPARRLNDDLQTRFEEIPMAGLDRDRQIQDTRMDRKILKPNDNIQYKIQDDDGWIHAKVLGRAGKATGRNKHWYNIVEDISKEKKSIDLDKVKWEYLTDNVHQVLEISGNNDNISDAKMAELHKLKQFSTYEEVNDCGQNILSTRWVITTKNGQTKARLVVRGFEEEFLMQSDSPTVGKGTMRIFLTLASIHNWTVKTTDIKSAFLQGQEIKRDVYIKPPKEYENAKGVIWKLRHGLYGLKDGARQFYLSVKEEVQRLGCQISKMDPAMFFLYKNGKLSGIICCHVDDFLHAGDESLETIMISLRKRFVAGKVEEGNFDYVGFRVMQQPREIFLDQSRYVGSINSQTFDTKRMQQKEDKLTAEEQSVYRQVIGKINWAVQGTRPDIAFELIDLSTKLKQATVGDLSRAVKTVNRLKDVRSIISFPRLSRNVSDWRIVIFTDASLCNINSGTGSTAAYVVWLADKEGKCCPLDWHANKIKRVVRSTIAAEALSLQEGLECGYYYRQMLEDIMKLQRNTIPIIAYVDNKSVIDAVHSTKLVDDKRLRVDLAAISESLGRNEVKEIRWCPGRYHLADCMTKRGASGYNLLEVIHGGHFSEEFI